MPSGRLFVVVVVLLWLAQSGTSQAPSRCATTTTLSGPFTDIIVELGEVNCFTCSQVWSWTANNDMGNPISVTSASALEIGGVTVVEVEGNYLVLPSPGQYVLTGNSGRRNIICSDNTGEQYEARLSNPTLVAPRFNPVTVNEFTRLEIRCDNVVPSNVGQAQIFNPDGEMVGVSSYTVADATREFAGTYSCVATSRIDPNITATTTAEVIIQHAPDITPANSSSNEIFRFAELHLTCVYVGVPAPDLQWIHNDSIALSSTSPGVSVVGGQPGDSTSSIVIGAVDLDSGGTYTCRANNSLGTAEVVYTVHILRLPVNFLTVTVLNESTAFVQWEHQDTADSYEIQVQAIDAPDIPSKEIVLRGNFRNWSIDNLAAGKRYRFTITPIYDGEIPGADVSTVQTMMESTPRGPPRNVRVIFSVTTFYVIWEEPSFAEQGGTILSYDIFYRIVQENSEASTPSMFTAVSSTTLDNSSNVIQIPTDESSASQVYEVKIRAVNRVGSGPNSTLVAATLNSTTSNIPTTACQMSATTAIYTVTVTGPSLRVKNTEYVGAVTASSLLGTALVVWIVVSIVIITRLLVKSRARVKEPTQHSMSENVAYATTLNRMDVSENAAYTAVSQAAAAEVTENVAYGQIAATNQIAVDENVAYSQTQTAGDTDVIYTTIDDGV